MARVEASVRIVSMDLGLGSRDGHGNHVVAVPVRGATQCANDPDNKPSPSEASLNPQNRFQRLCHSERSEESSGRYAPVETQRRPKWILRCAQNDKPEDFLSTRGEPRSCAFPEMA